MNRNISNSPRPAQFSEVRCAAGEVITTVFSKNDGPSADVELRSDWEQLFQELQIECLRYRELFDFASDACLVTDVNGVILDANHAAGRLFQVRREFLKGKPLGFFIAPRCRRDFYARLIDLKNRRFNRFWEGAIAPPWGEEREVQMHISGLQAEEESSKRIQWRLHDTTREKQIDAEIQRERNLSESLFQSIGIALLVLDENNRVIRCNEFCSLISGTPASQIIGRDWCDLFFSEGNQAYDMLEQARVHGVGTCPLLGIYGKNGQSREIRWSAKLILDPSRSHQLLVLGQDVTVLEAAQRRLRHSERLASIGEATARLAHECRNAMQRIQVGISVLGLMLHDPTVQEVLARMQRAQNDLSILFDAVRTQVSSISLHFKEVDLSEIWRAAWEDLCPANQDATLTEDILARNLLCNCSEFHLRQVFRNLFENAIAAAGPTARITIHCRPALLNQNDALVVAVRDNGAGFTPLQRARAFESFFTTKKEGTGLGLPICQSIVIAHGGTIEIGGEHGQGGEIVIVIPRNTQ